MPSGTTSPDVAAIHDAVARHLDASREALEAFSLDIHAHPELAFEERYASTRLTERLEGEGFTVERGLGGIETAFRATATFGSGGPTIAILAEYDALPEMGHACGHNLICTAGLGAAVAAKHALEGSGANGRLLVVGTPAEEGGGGKILLLEQGAFDGVDAALMFHPGARTMTIRGSLAATRVTMKFHGRAAHAASTPHLGINALDACIGTFNAINALRQHVRDETKIHGIITKGGTAPNIVPDYAEAKFLVRHRSFDYVMELKERVFDCARGAALAAGARVEFEEGLAYAERKINETLAHRFGRYLEELGEEVKPAPAVGGVGSSDFGNLSQALPAIHPYIRIAPEGTSAHTPEFAAAAASPEGMRALHLAAHCLARTAVDLLTDHAFLRDVKEEFAR